MTFSIFMGKEYSFEATIEKVEKMDGAYVRVPYNIKEMFGKGRLKVKAYFEDVEYEGSIVNMGVKNEDGSICYILGMRKDIRKKLNKQPGDKVNVKFMIREDK